MATLHLVEQESIPQAPPAQLLLSVTALSETTMDKEFALMPEVDRLAAIKFMATPKEFTSVEDPLTLPGTPLQETIGKVSMS
jgi:hypothetical protein